MVEESYVSFETAKLLKEKGFDVPCNSYWFIGTDKTFDTSKCPLNYNEMKSDVEWLSCPTQQVAMKWLREEKGIFIEISVSVDLNGGYHYSYSILDKECKYIRKGLSFEWNYEDAVEAAIKVCLENLI